MLSGISKPTFEFPSDGFVNPNPIQDKNPGGPWSGGSGKGCPGRVEDWAGATATEVGGEGCGLVPSQLRAKFSSWEGIPSTHTRPPPQPDPRRARRHPENLPSPQEDKGCPRQSLANPPPPNQQSTPSPSVKVVGMLPGSAGVKSKGPGRRCAPLGSTSATTETRRWVFRSHQSVLDLENGLLVLNH